MTLKSISSQLGKGGTGLSDGQLKDILTELQGLTVSVVAGTTADTKINLAAIRKQDTIISVIQHVGAGTAVTDLADVTSTTTIAETHATGTVTCASVAAADTVTVRGKVYTFRVTPSASAHTTEVAIGGSDNASAANLAAAINANDTALVAVAAANVVTLTANADGTAGNAYTLATSNNTRLAKSGATLAGGTATGGILNSQSTASSKLVVTWFNKS
jgi:hypothetical protein